MNSNNNTLSQPKPVNELTSQTEKTISQTSDFNEITPTADSATSTHRISHLGIESTIRIDRLCDEYENALGTSEDCRLESWLANCDRRDYPVVLQELLVCELGHRVRLGLPIDVMEYQRRFVSDWNLIEPLVRQYCSDSDATLEFCGPANSTEKHDSAAHPSREKFGDYELLGDHGTDGEWWLRRANQPALRRVVLLKTPRLGLSEERNRELAIALQAEAAATARVEGLGVVPALDSGYVSGTPFLTLGLVDGETLASRLQRGPIDNRTAADYARQISETLFRMHEVGVRHGHLRPEDVFIGRDGRVRITGIASLASCFQVVTPYTPPEYHGNFSDPIDDGIDMYGVGALLYAMLTARPPYEAADEDALWNLIRFGRLTPPRRINRKISSDLNAIVEKCFNSDRYRSYRGKQVMVPLIADLRRYLSGYEVKVSDKASWKSLLLWGNRNRRLILELVAVILFLWLSRWVDQRRIQQSWTTVLDANVSPESAARERRFFQRRATYQPHDPQFAPGVELATLREYGPRVALDTIGTRSTSSGHYSWKGDLTGSSTLSRIRAIIALRLGYSDEAKLLLQADESFLQKEQLLDQSRDQEYMRRRLLDDEIADLKRDGDLLAMSVNRGNVSAFNSVPTARMSPALLDALIDRINCRDISNSVDKLFIGNQSEGVEDLARNAWQASMKCSDSQAVINETLPGIITKSISPSRIYNDAGMMLAQIIYNDASMMLAQIGESWPQNPQARRAIGPLVARLAMIPNNTAVDQIQFINPKIEELLNRIDPNWRTAPEAADSLPELIEYMDHLFLDTDAINQHAKYEPNIRYEPVWRVLDLLKILGPRASGASESLKKLTEQPGLCRTLGAAGLAIVDESWAGSDEAKAILESLTDSLAVQEHEAVHPSDTTASLVLLAAVNRDLAMMGLIVSDRSDHFFGYGIGNPIRPVLEQLDPNWRESNAVRMAIAKMGDLIRQNHKYYLSSHLRKLVDELNTSSINICSELISMIYAHGEIYNSSADWAIKTLDHRSPQWRIDERVRTQLTDVCNQLVSAQSRENFRARSGIAKYLATRQLVLDDRAIPVLIDAVEGDENRCQVACNLVRGLGWRTAKLIPALSESTFGPSLETLQFILDDAMASKISRDEFRSIVGDALEPLQLLRLLGHTDEQVRNSTTAVLDLYDVAWRDFPETKLACKYWTKELDSGYDSPQWKRAATALKICNAIPSIVKTELLRALVAIESGQERWIQQRSWISQVEDLCPESGADANAIVDRIDLHQRSFWLVSESSVDEAAWLPTLLAMTTADRQQRLSHYYKIKFIDPRFLKSEALRSQIKTWCGEFSLNPIESPALFALESFAGTEPCKSSANTIVPALQKCLAANNRIDVVSNFLIGLGPSAADTLPGVLKLYASSKDGDWQRVKQLEEIADALDPNGVCGPEVASVWKHDLKSGTELLNWCRDELARAKRPQKGQTDYAAYHPSLVRAFFVLGHLRHYAAPVASELVSYVQNQSHGSEVLQVLERIGPGARSITADLIEQIPCARYNDQREVDKFFRCLATIDPNWATAKEHRVVRDKAIEQVLAKDGFESPIEPYVYRAFFRELVRLQAEREPTASLSLKIKPIDLSDSANTLSSGKLGTDEVVIAEPPTGEVMLNNTRFLIGEQCLRVSGQIDPQITEFSDLVRIDQIAVGAIVNRLHLLHAYWGQSSRGETLGYYRVHYNDGSTDLIPIISEQNIRCLYISDDDPNAASPTFAKAVWIGSPEKGKRIGSRKVLCDYVWTNPFPDLEIASIDFVSFKQHGHSLFLLALSAETYE